jgi:hypothetical protein
MTLADSVDWRWKVAVWADMIAMAREKINRGKMEYTTFANKTISISGYLPLNSRYHHIS